MEYTHYMQCVFRPLRSVLAAYTHHWVTIVEDFEPVTFISIENEDDLTLSFFIAPPEDPTNGRSLMLIRSTKWEILIPDEEKGAKVSDEAWLAEEKWEDNFLERIQLGDTTAVVDGRYSQHKLDLRTVDSSDLRAARKILKKMNFDKRFKLEFV